MYPLGLFQDPVTFLCRRKGDTLEGAVSTSECVCRGRGVVLYVFILRSLSSCRRACVYSLCIPARVERGDAGCFADGCGGRKYLSSLRKWRSCLRNSGMRRQPYRSNRGFLCKTGLSLRFQRINIWKVPIITDNK